MYGLSHQMRRAAVSVPANIAAGFRSAARPIRRGSHNSVRSKCVTQHHAGTDLVLPVLGQRPPRLFRTRPGEGDSRDLRPLARGYRAGDSEPRPGSGSQGDAGRITVPVRRIRSESGSEPQRKGAVGLAGHSSFDFFFPVVSMTCIRRRPASLLSLGIMRVALASAL